MSEYPLAHGYNPLYPLKAQNQNINENILQLVELHIYQFMINVFGKTETFHYLENRFEKVNYQIN